MTQITILFISFALFSILKVQPIDFQVGGDKGWSIPPSNDTRLFDQWASKNRFNINDTLRFEYKKDSVLVVSKEEHEKCKSVHPVFFSNNGDTSFELDRSGFFYFISGVSGHCERGLKMIVKVLEPENVAAQSANQTASMKNGGMGLVKMSGDMYSQISVVIMGSVSLFMMLFV
ncbi:mavicyanin-like [Cynara cardunculus var. scolymus]|uniref:Phytocyanin domain-containing protein n=1 Tax=Cynara cardunculus var. scolymus TaxID=59895 RepID=A0A103YCC8_CYNCS|nr:mavicyanin-like [Cynara cardunculus var. scolymus]KVI06477.1 hypothetical protein Ccrd_015168 [Cynara cardunculus var. scolymus]